MNKEHKKYILENLGKKSIRQLSEELHLKERYIKRFLEEQNMAKGAHADSPKAATNRLGNKNILVSIALIVVLGCLAYINSLNNEFVYDDQRLIVDNVYVKNWAHIPDILSKDIGAGIREPYNFYRPITMLTYMLNYALGGLRPNGYHFTNMLLHILVALSLYLFGNILLRNNVISTIASILFIVHPLHTEAVTYISGRADLLAALFMMLSCSLYIKYLHGGNKFHYVAILASYLCAILSKEYSLILPIFILLYHVAFKERIAVFKFLSLIGIGTIYVFSRGFFLHFSAAKPVLATVTVAQRLPGFFVALINYVRLMLLPFGLHMEYGSQLFSWADPRTITGIALFLFLLLYVLKKRNEGGVVFFSITWFLIGLLPVSNIYPINAYMAEHWLYIPSIGFFLIAAKGLEFLYRNASFKFFAVTCVIALAAGSTYLTMRQNGYWKNELVFCERTIAYSPDSVGAYNNLGLEYAKKGESQKAIDAYKKCIELNPDNKDAYVNLGILYFRMHREVDAIEAYQKAIALDPNLAEAYNNLGNAYSAMGRKEDALKSYQKAIEIWPYFADAYNNLGSESEDPDEAIKAFQKAIELNPDHKYAYYNLSEAYRRIGKIEEAERLYKKAKEVNPDLSQ